MKMIKRIIGLVLAACLLVVGIPLSASADDQNGVITGESGGTLSISSVSDLEWIAEETKKGNTFDGETVYISGDIDCGGVQLASIGTKDHPFMGNVEGSNHTISNFVSANGLFSYVSGSVTFSNINVSLANVNVNDCNYTSILIGHLSLADNDVATVYNCNLSGVISHKGWASWAAASCIGEVLISGQASLRIRKVMTESEISLIMTYAYGEHAYGGIIGSVKDSSRKGTISIEKCFCKDKLSGDSAGGYSHIYYGGLVGKFDGGLLSVDQCAIDSNIGGAAYYVYCGGLIGYAYYNQLFVSNCSVLGSISSATHSGAATGAGILGYNNCAANQSESYIKNSYVAAESSVPIRGGIVSQNESSTDSIPLIHVYYDMDKSKLTSKTALVLVRVGFIISYNWVNNSSNATSSGLTTAEMKSQGSYVDWDFSSVWSMGENGYPTLTFIGNGDTDDVGDLAYAKGIAVFTTEKSMSVKTGDSLWLGFGLLRNDGLIDDTWRKMAIVVSDPTVISISDYVEEEYGYSIEAKGLKVGASSITVTDTTTGLHNSFIISVYDQYVRNYSYSMTKMDEFYPEKVISDNPDHDWNNESKILTNIYNLNGLYINNYICKKENGKYIITFDAYNSKYYYAAVDIYAADGTWLGYETIDKYSDISSLWSTGERTFWLIHDAIDHKLYTYEQESFSKHTSVSFEVPEDGYFVISNNVVTSPGCFLSNAIDILYDAASSALDAFVSEGVLHDKPSTTSFDSFAKEMEKSFAQRIIDARNEGLSSEVKKQTMDILQGSMKSKVEDITRSFATSDIKNQIISAGDMRSQMATLAEEVISAYKLDWKSTFKTATGVGESFFTKFAGPAGVALKGCFAISKGSNKLLMAYQMGMSSNNTYATVYSSVDEGFVNSHGVVVNTRGNVNAEAKLQVFRVSESSGVEVVLDSENPLEKHELYNICFVKNEQLVQPSGKVEVRIPIPTGLNGDTCTVYRQEKDNSWTILEAHRDGNYMIFETDHFSLYAIAGDLATISVKKLPTKTTYELNEMLSTEGLVLDLDGEEVTAGFLCTPTAFATTGKESINVLFGDTSTTFEILVTKNTATIAGLTPAKATYDGTAKAGYTGTPTSDYTGSYDTSYAGRNDTTYGSTTPPVNAGDYTVTISVQEDDPAYTGSVSLDFTISKGTQSAPSAPELNSKTHDSVTLAAVAENANGAVAQYSRDDGATWQSEPIFTGLTAGTEYSLIVRYAGTSNYEPSPASAVLKVTTDAEPTATPTPTPTPAPSTEPTATPAPSGSVTPPVTPSPKPTEEPSPEPIEEPVPEISFTDVADDAYYADAVKWAVAKGITVGTSETTFSPNADCTRGQIVTFLWRAAGSPEPVSTSNPFTDIKSTDYFYKAVLWAVENNITYGTSATSFSPGAPCTRAQSVTFLWRAEKNPASSKDSDFADVLEGQYYTKAVAWAVEHDITKGTGNNKFSPEDTCTRGQIVTFLYRDLA